MAKKNFNVHDGFNMLIQSIEKLSNQKIDFNSVDDSISLDELNRRDARRAHEEITRERIEKHKKFVSSVYADHLVNPKWTFNSILIDQLNKPAIDIARGFCASSTVESNSKPSLLIIQGEPGSGKTVLSNCIANEFLNNYWKDVELTNYTQIKRIRVPNSTDTYFDRTEKNNKWEHLLNVDLLIIDGLCQNNEVLSDWDKQNLSELLRTRCNLNKMLVITTPITLNFLVQHIGNECFESLKEYTVMPSVLYGQSRRPPIF